MATEQLAAVGALPATSAGTSGELGGVGVVQKSVRRLEHKLGVSVFLVGHSNGLGHGPVVGGEGECGGVKLDTIFAASSVDAVVLWRAGSRTDGNLSLRLCEERDGKAVGLIGLYTHVAILPIREMCFSQTLVRVGALDCPVGGRDKHLRRNWVCGEVGKVVVQGAGWHGKEVGSGGRRPILGPKHLGVRRMGINRIPHCPIEIVGSRGVLVGPFLTHDPIDTLFSFQEGGGVAEEQRQFAAFVVIQAVPAVLVVGV